MKGALPGTCVAPSGEFVYCIHKPQFTASNLRGNDYVVDLGKALNQETIYNADNFPDNDVQATSADWIYEIPNAFPFMGATFILKSKADQTPDGHNPFGDLLIRDPQRRDDVDLETQSRSSLLSLASTSTDPGILTKLAEGSCRFTYDEEPQLPTGMIHDQTKKGDLQPVILDFQLFQLVSNNPFLPDEYKRAMVLTPGVQGKSPIVGEYVDGDTHIWEYLRENSYVPWGHYAANMAHDAVRYKAKSLTEQDIVGLRHLYYQRIYVQLSIELGMPVEAKRRSLTPDELEDLRLSLVAEIGKRNKSGHQLPFNTTIWGQNFGFDLSPSGYRLSASHQQIHQQFALVRANVPSFVHGENKTRVATMPTYSQGDVVDQFIGAYKEETGRDFFETYLEAIRNNHRLDGRTDKEKNLIFHQDENVIGFVPKAQRSQGEVQVMAKVKCGNVLEADPSIRDSLDRAILLTMKMLENLGVEMFTAFEISKRLDNPNPDQRLLYCFLPRHPRSPGGFSEFQQRWISNHYPEDFAKVCRDELHRIIERG
ncbi:MAG: hypothetical protein KJP05_07110 [Deltaproteobacteria bacterium]|nr:hypothetical protein [Deltaproteobacteria bacterium]